MVDKKSQIKILNKYKLITNQYFIIPVSEVKVFSARPSQGDAQFQLTMATEQNYNSAEGRYICQHIKI